MAIEEKTSPWELLFRFDPLTGLLGGAHYQDALIIVRDGQVISVSPGAAMPVALAAGDPGRPVAEVLGEAMTAAIAATDAATTRAEAAETALADALAEISRLTAVLASSPASPPEPTDPTGVPASVTRFQARAALFAAGLLDDVEATIAGADRFVQIAWADAASFERGSPTIAALATALGLSDQQLDDLFRAAAKIAA